MCKSTLALTYHVEGALGALSNNLPHQVSIAVLPFEATIQYMTVPKVQPAAYLQATVKNTSDYRPTPRTVHVFVGDSFVSETGIIEDAAPGGEFSYVTRRRVSTGAPQRAPMTRPRECECNASSEKWAATTYRSCMTVANRRPFAQRELVLCDSVSVCVGGRDADDAMDQGGRREV